MAAGLTNPRLTLGGNARLVHYRINGIFVESAVRLRPGHAVEIQLREGEDGRVRWASVATWAVARLGSDGPTYAGVCEWI
ncbi:MAG TPA: hypothetical protein VFV98_20485 [Vicinamibacterales bacterium]|nr:hypothetical protein [Vicinamibacterales bacterium]